VGSNAKMTCRGIERPRVFGDESGCTGYSFADGSTTYFTVALVVVSDADLLMRAVEAYHMQQWKQRRELHFKDMKPDARHHLLSFLMELHDVPFDVRALVVNKERLPPKGRPGTDKVYEQFVADAFGLCDDIASDAIAKMDKSNHGGPRVLSRILDAVNRQASSRVIHDLQFAPSHGNYGIQVADVFCGAVQKAYEKNDPQYLDTVRKKVKITPR
jgi:hypothetical protein